MSASTAVPAPQAAGMGSVICQPVSKPGLQPLVLCSFSEAGAAEVDKTAGRSCPRRWRCRQLCSGDQRTSRPPAWPPVPALACQSACCSGDVVSARTVRQCNIGVFCFRQSSACLVVMVTEVKSLQQRKGAVVAPTSRHSVVWVCTLEPELRHSRQEVLLGFGCWAVGLTWKIICCEVRGLPWRQNCLVAEMKVAAALYLPWG